jgi:hypothetical protein
LVRASSILGFIVVGIGIIISVSLYFFTEISSNVQLNRLAKAYIGDLSLEREYVLAKFTDIVTLIYFQGRNVRHLLRKGKKIDSKYIILRDSLAAYRYYGWTQIQPLRTAALSAKSGKAV